MVDLTKEEFEAFVKKEFTGREYKWEYDDKTGTGYFYIQAGTGKYSADELHYEFIDGRVRLHIEGDRWWNLRDGLYAHLKHHDDELTGAVWNKRQNCQWILKPEKEDVFSMFRRISVIVEPELMAYEGQRENRTTGNVSFKTQFLDELFKCKLNIPGYQRIYCWGEERVITLLDDILNIKTSNYYLGNIILHTNNGKLDIVDGQQRLVTLAILAYKLKHEKNGLLDSKYESFEAQNNIFRNARVIDNYLKSHNNEALRVNIEKLSFGVLTIDSQHLDLAFTFFNNTNSRGKPLTDYDLLKPHHLRYIPSDYESQQELLAEQWDKMINNSKTLADNPEKPELRRDADYIHVLELYLYRLRKWSRNNYCDEFDRYIYSEYRSAPIIEEIPPFGEQFDFYEPIQGGQHFFEYVEHFMQKYREFAMMHEVDKDGNRIDNVMDILCSNFSGHSDKWYRYIIESLIFCYFLKFGTQYIPEASLSITRYISQIRFEKGRAYEPTIVNYAKESGITLMILQATSPTFFLAEIENKIKNLDGIPKFSGIREDFFNKCLNVSKSLQKKCISNSFKNYFATRYERITSK